MHKYRLERRGKSAEMILYGPIGDRWGEGISARQVVDDLKGLPAEVTHLDVRINSDGGSIADGYPIYNALGRWRGEVTAYVDGFALSVASLILQAAGRRVIAENGWLMIHQPWTLAAGDAARLRKEADLLDQFTGTAAKIYADRAGVSIEQALAWMPPGEETWLDAAGAMNAGLADAMSENVKAAASTRWVRIDRYHPPATLAAQLGDIDEDLRAARLTARARLARQGLALARATGYASPNSPASGLEY